MKKQTLTFKFTLMFAAFTLLTLLISSFLSYMNQMKLYKTQREESIQYVADYLEQIVKLDGDDFLNFQNFFIANYKDFKIPKDFDENDVLLNRQIYESMFAKNYPGKTLGKDIEFDELSYDLKKAFALYRYEYYRIKFEQAAKSFNIAYAYYLVPTGEPEHMYWFLDVARDPEEEGSPYLYLCYDVLDPVDKHRCMWEAWETGKRPSGYDIYDETFQYGSTYAYYSPLIISGQKIGVIGVEVSIGNVNSAIFHATIRQMIMIGGVLIIFTIILLFIIRTNYIRKLVKLRNIIEDYSQNKDAKIAETLAGEVTNHDEISTIMAKFAEMIYEIESYIENLTKTRLDLLNKQKQVIEMSELANKDSLTGIRNKTAYDKEVKKLEWEMSSGLKELGVAMIDLNFLKRINDTYGHDKGNVAIISLCKLVCHIFEHSPVFRIGGDEFVVILKGHDLKHVDELIEEFNQKLKELHENPVLEYWEKTSAAIGYAVYNPEIDSAYDNIFKRADSEMYKVKKAMKAVREC